MRRAFRRAIGRIFVPTVAVITLISTPLHPALGQDLPSFSRRRIVLVAADDVRVEGLQISAGRETLLIYGHKLLDSKDTFDFEKSGRRLLAEFDVLTIDFRGHGKSADLSTAGGDEVLDLRAAVDYARHSGYKRVVVLGVGMGGVVAIREAALFKNVEAVVALSPAGDPNRLKPWWWNITCRISLGSDFGIVPLRLITRTRIGERYWTGFPGYMADRVAPIPLLLIHGEGSRYLNTEQVRAIYERAREPKTLLLLPGGGHAEELLDADTQDFIVDWIEAHLSSHATTVTKDFGELGGNERKLAIQDVEICGDSVLPRWAISNALTSSGGDSISPSDVAENVQSAYWNRGYTLARVTGVRVERDDCLVVDMDAGHTDRVLIEGNRIVDTKAIQGVLRISERDAYNAWEVESALKRLRTSGWFRSAQAELDSSKEGNVLSIRVREKKLCQWYVNSKCTDIDDFFGVRTTFNEFYPYAPQGTAEVMVGIKRGYVSYNLALRKSWSALTAGLRWGREVKSWDEVDYHFTRQEHGERGLSAMMSYAISADTRLHLALSWTKFLPIRIREALPVDKGVVHSVSIRLNNCGRWFRRWFVLEWENNGFLEHAERVAGGDYEYTIFQWNFRPRIVFPSMQTLGFRFHWGTSRGNLPQQKLFSLGGMTTLPGYDDDAFVGRHLFLIRGEYWVAWKRWLPESSRFAPLKTGVFCDLANTWSLRGDSYRDRVKVDVGLELNYASAIRLSIVKGVGKFNVPARIFVGWGTHFLGV